MPAGHGFRSRTRDLFSRAFKKKGYIPLSTYLKTYHIGDFIDVKAKGEVINTKRQPKGMKPGFIVEGAIMETVTPIPYDVVNDLKGGY